MAEAKKCPKCKLVNPSLAQRCDCGYDFVSRSVEASYLIGRHPDTIDATRIEKGISLLLPMIDLLLGVVARSNGRTRASNRMFFMCLIGFMIQFIISILIITVTLIFRL
jgi:hypothetical protein